MKPNVYDKVVTKTLSRVEKASDSISKQFKGVTPFNKEPIKKEDLLKSYEMLTPDDMLFLVRKHGADKVNDMIYEMEQMKNSLGVFNA